MSFKINIKLSGVGETFQVEVNPEDTVEKIIEKCCEARNDLEKDRVTLVFKGRILKPDQTAEALKLAEDMTIHLVRKPAPKGSKPAATSGTATSGATSGSAPTSSAGNTGTSGNTGTGGSSTASNPFANLGGLGGMGGGLPNLASGGGLSGMGGMNMDPNTISQMMSNPMYQQMMDQMLQNPDFMNQMIENNPQLRAMADANPQVREMLQNPELMRSMMTPEAMQASMNLMNNANPNSMSGTMSGAPGSMAAPGGGSSSSGATGTSGTGSGATGAAGTTGTGKY